MHRTLTHALYSCLVLLFIYCFCATSTLLLIQRTAHEDFDNKLSIDQLQSHHPLIKMTSQLTANHSILSADERQTADLLIAADQAHLFSHWPAPGTDDDKKHRFLAQCAQIEKDYIGGIATYVQRAKHLLAFAATGGNPYEGYRVSEPKSAVRLESLEDFAKYEQLGLSQLAHTAFVIVAGGLGERLGYKGIKLALPSEIVTETSFIQLYIQHILAMQQYARDHSGSEAKDLELPLGIMTSDDTHALTVALLEKNSNFGMTSRQLTIFKQGKVPSLVDNDAHFCLDESDKYVLDTKPHGHGDVHQLLYQHGLVEKWVSSPQKVKYITFFQDTNGLVFHSILASLGVSAEQRLEVNSITVPRVQGDAVGAICTLERDPEFKAPAGAEELPANLTINVEYNQLEGLLGKGAKEPTVPGTNFSVYPGNINVLIFDAPAYLKVLQDKKGVISEFVNPKYKPDKQSFKKPTRLECMMQDYPKLLSATARVGFAQFQRWTAFSAVKNAIADGADKQRAGNSAEVAATGECDLFTFAHRMLTQAGCDVAKPAQQTFKGVSLEQPPKIVLTPVFGLSQQQIQSHFRGKHAIQIKNTNHATALVLDGAQIELESLSLDGALVIRAHKDARVTVRDLKVANKGWTYDELSDDKMMQIDQKYAVRGYTLTKHEAEVYVFDKPGSYELTPATKAQFAAKQ